MYAKIENGQIVGMFYTLPNAYNNISGFNSLSPTKLKSFGFYEVEEIDVTHNDLTELKQESTIFDGTKVTRTYTISKKPLDEIKAAFTKAIQVHLDNVAQARGYDDIVSACSYAAADNLFKNDGLSAIIWRSSIWAYCYSEFDKVASGVRTMPTIEDFILELPTITWPI